MKLTEKELNEFPIGTKITTRRNYEYEYIKIGLLWVNISYVPAKDIINQNIVRVEIPTYTEYIPPKPILDDKEKEYLSAVIRPWRKKARAVLKGKYEEREFVKILSKNHEMSVVFPYYKAGTMYKGMELDREYSLEELGI